MRITRQKLRRLIIETLQEADTGECLDPGAPPWQDFLKALRAAGIPYTELNDDERLEVEILYEDAVDAGPSGLRALFRQHHRKYPAYILITDFYPRGNVGYDETRIGKPSTNDVRIALADITVLDEDFGIVLDSEDYYYIDSRALNTLPGPSC